MLDNDFRSIHTVANYVFIRCFNHFTSLLCFYMKFILLSWIIIRSIVSSMYIYHSTYQLNYLIIYMLHCILYLIGLVLLQLFLNLICSYSSLGICVYNFLYFSFLQDCRLCMCVLIIKLIYIYIYICWNILWNTFDRILLVIHNVTDILQHITVTRQQIKRRMATQSKQGRKQKNILWVCFVKYATSFFIHRWLLLWSLKKSFYIAH